MVVVVGYEERPQSERTMTMIVLTDGTTMTWSEYQEWLAS